MPSTFQFVEQRLEMATAGIEPGAINAALAKFARAELAKVISAGAPAEYEIYVNGRRGATEESVRAPGPIVYQFVNWARVIIEALLELRRRSPRRTGRYHASFMVLASQQIVTDYQTIPPDAEVVIFNPQPYTRKMESGANGTGRRHFDGSKVALNRKFRDGWKFEAKFLDVRRGVNPLVPYILKHSQGRRRDRQAGMPITYPALIINAV